MGKSVSVGQLPDRTEQVLTRAGGRVEVVVSLSQGRTAAAQCGLFTYKSVPVIFEPPCTRGEFKPMDLVVLADGLGFFILTVDIRGKRQSFCR